MLLILSGIIMAVILTTVFFCFSSGYAWWNLVCAGSGTVLGILTGLTAICFCFVVWQWQAADYKTAIINREYKTNYTKEEVFYASDVIDAIRELDRKRIELNGDIIKGIK